MKNIIFVFLFVMSTPAFAECLLFEKNLKSCTPYICKYTHESGKRYTKEIRRPNDYTCSVSEKLPGSKLRGCLLRDNLWESGTLDKAECDIEEIQVGATLSSETDPLFKKMYLEILKDRPVSVNQINSQELLQVFSSSFFKVVIEGGPIFMVAKSGNVMDVLYRSDNFLLTSYSYILNHLDPAFRLNNEEDAATLRRALLAVHLGKEGGSRGANIVRKNGANWELICEESPIYHYLAGYVIETEGAGRITNIFWSNDFSK